MLKMPSHKALEATDDGDDSRGENPNDFFNTHHHYDTISEVRVYDKKGKLKITVSSKEQLDSKWKSMNLNPMANAPFPSSNVAAKRKRGQQINREKMSFAGSLDFSSHGKFQRSKLPMTLCRLCGNEFRQTTKRHVYCLPTEGKRSCRLIHQDKKRKKIPVEKTCANPSCNNVFLQTRKDRRFCIKPCRAKAKYIPQRDTITLKGK
jgi:hypothetical protein